MSFNPRLFIYLSIGFMVCTVIGTLSHEFGHYAVARYQGIDVKINYMSTQYEHSKEMLAVRDTFKRFWHEVDRDGKRDSAETVRLEQLIKLWEPYRQTISQRVWFTLGGPLQTILTGTLGLILILCFYKQYRSKESLGANQWIIIFMALFWLRQSANFLGQIARYLLNGTWGHSDEVTLAKYWHTHPLLISAITGMTGLLVLAFITFKVVPQKQRITFMAAGLVGGLSGYAIWFGWLGPILLP